jgi:serine/threonine-protein kinase
MDRNLRLSVETLRGRLILPPDVTLTPVKEIDPSLHERVGGEPGDTALTRAYTRQPSKIIDSDLATLISRFREPKTIPEAVAQHAKATGDKADELLEAALDVFTELLQASILLPETDRSVDGPITLQNGDWFGDCEIIECIQVFSDSQIYKVRYADGVAALKIGYPDGNGKITDRFAREARILRCLDGEFAPQLLAEGAIEGDLYLVQEWIAGSNIATVAAELRQEEDYDGLLQLLQKTVEAYARLLSKGILHGDIHPRNIIVSATGQVRLIDFGLARQLDEADEPTERGGVAFFYEPEAAAAALEGQPIPTSTSAGEQFSVGALLFNLVTGNYYDDFDLEREAMFSAIREAKPKPFSVQGGVAWPSLEACLAKALAPDPNNRYTGYDAFLAALTRCDAAEPATKTKTSARIAQIEHSKVSAFVEALLDELAPESPLFRNGLGKGPTCTINGGAAGIAYALYRLACGREDAGLLSLANVWIERVHQDQANPEAFRNPGNELHDKLVGPVSVHHREPGVLWVAALIDLATGDLSSFDQKISRFIEEIEAPCKQRDVTLGRCSAILACAALADALDGTLSSLRDLIVARGSWMLDALWEEVASFDVIGNCREWNNLGLAHGWAGLLYTSLRWHRATGHALPEAFERRAHELLQCTHPVGRGLNVPWYMGNNHVTPGMPGWCNGAAGLVHLGCLAHEVYGGEHWLDFAERATWHTWESEQDLVDLCCGTAGRAYALLEFYRQSGEPRWLERARRLASSAIERAPMLRADEHPRYSLFKGELGLGLVLDELTRPETAMMPLMGVEP